MTNRELLELAATAAGFVDFDWLSGDDLMNVYQKDGKHEHWNPLTDDGDALRLAADLRLTINLTECQCCVGIYACQLDSEDEPDVSVRYSKDFDDCEAKNVHEATRLAIVRAAAAIGEKMEERP